MPLTTRHVGLRDSPDLVEVLWLLLELLDEVLRVMVAAVVQGLDVVTAEHLLKVLLLLMSHDLKLVQFATEAVSKLL